MSKVNVDPRQQSSREGQLPMNRGGSNFWTAASCRSAVRERWESRTQFNSVRVKVCKK